MLGALVWLTVANLDISIVNVGYKTMRLIYFDISRTSLGQIFVQEDRGCPLVSQAV